MIRSPSQRNLTKCNLESFRVAKIQGRLLFYLLFRLNVNNADYVKHKEKKDRALNYWKDRVSQDFLPPIDPQKKQQDNLDQLIKLREERSPNRLVSEMKEAQEKKKPGFKIKQQNMSEASPSGEQNPIVGYNDEEIEKGLVGTLPDELQGGAAAGSGNVKIKMDPTKRVPRKK